MSLCTCIQRKQSCRWRKVWTKLLNYQGSVRKEESQLLEPSVWWSEITVYIFNSVYMPWTALVISKHYTRQLLGRGRSSCPHFSDKNWVQRDKLICQDYLTGSDEKLRFRTQGFSGYRAQIFLPRGQKKNENIQNICKKQYHCNCKQVASLNQSLLIVQLIFRGQAEG